jgi:putative oxidoreductase
LFGAAVGLLDRLSWLAPLLARAVIGVVFGLSGWGKLHNLDRTVEYFNSLGIPGARYQAPMAALFEVVCGVAVLLGLFTRLASIPLIVIMIVALKTTKADELFAAGTLLDRLNGLFGLSEFLYLVLLFWLAVAGAGPLSLDRLFFRRRELD